MLNSRSHNCGIPLVECASIQFVFLLPCLICQEQAGCVVPDLQADPCQGETISSSMPQGKVLWGPPSGSCWNLSRRVCWDNRNIRPPVKFHVLLCCSELLDPCKCPRQSAPMPPFLHISAVSPQVSSNLYVATAIDIA